VCDGGAAAEEGGGVGYCIDGTEGGTAYGCGA